MAKVVRAAGRVALGSALEFYPPADGEIVVGRNPIGVSAAQPEPTATVIAAERAMR